MNHLLEESKHWQLFVSSAAGAAQLGDSLPGGSSAQGLLRGLLLKNLMSLGMY